MALSPDIAPRELAAALHGAPAPVLIDVREPAEYVTGHLAGSSNVPLTELASALPSHAATTRIVFVCQTGVRSRQAVTFARMMGYAATRSLAGGLVSWRELGYPTSDTGGS